MDAGLIDTQAAIEHLKAQRNVNADEAAMLAGMVAARDAKIAEQEKEIAELKASVVPGTPKKPRKKNTPA